MAELSVQLLAVEGCPHLERAQRDLQAVLRESIIETPIQVVLVGSQEDAEFLRFPGSPTIRIDGEDVDPRPDAPIGLACRTYLDAQGRLVGSPPLERIRAVVQAHRRARLQSFQANEAGMVAATARAAAADEAADATGTEAKDARADQDVAEPPGAPPDPAA
ncbi:MAG TPA: hypothetical protein VF763_01145 [Candidatus Limnocylindrales bacterium]